MPIRILLFFICCLFFVKADAASFQASKPQAIKRLQDLQSKNLRALEEADRKLQKSFGGSMSITLKDLADAGANYTFETIREQIQSSGAEKRELLARTRFFDLLVHLTDSRFSDGNFRDFLSKTLLEMSISEAGVGTPDVPKEFGYAFFLTYASIALREIPEPIEDPVAFLDAYITFSTVTDPKPPHEFFLTKNYSNGNQYEKGSEFPPESLDKIEKKALQQAEEYETVSPPQPDVKTELDAVEEDLSDLSSGEFKMKKSTK